MLITKFLHAAISLIIVSLCVKGLGLSRGHFKRCECGESGLYEDDPERIINGQEVKDLKTYPWMVNIFKKRVNDAMQKRHLKKHYWSTCGGALISPTFVLTAAHCLPRNDEVDAENCKSSSEKCPLKEELEIGLMGRHRYKPAKIVSVKRTIPHPEFTSDGYEHDIALIELRHHVSCTPYRKPICIKPPKKVYKSGAEIRIAGFGRVRVDKVSRVLREGRVKIADNKKCLGPMTKLDDLKIFCVIRKGPTTLCKGDSGTSAFIRHEGSFYSLGVANGSPFHPLCSLKNPVIFTKTPAYFDFIKKYVKDLPKQPRI